MTLCHIRDGLEAIRRNALVDCGEAFAPHAHAFALLLALLDDKAVDAEMAERTIKFLHTRATTAKRLDEERAALLELGPCCRGEDDLCARACLVEAALRERLGDRG